MKIFFEESAEKEILSRNLSRAGGCPEIFGVEMESCTGKCEQCWEIALGKIEINNEKEDKNENH